MRQDKNENISVFCGFHNVGHGYLEEYSEAVNSSAKTVARLISKKTKKKLGKTISHQCNAIKRLTIILLYIIRMLHKYSV